MFWLKMVKSIINVLHSDISPRQLSAGIAMGAIIGLSPVNALHNYVIFFLILVLKVNIGAAILSVAVFKLLAFIVDPVADMTGYALLVKAGVLKGFWTHLYSMPVVPYTRFNNTVVLGSFIIALVLFYPILAGSEKLILKYRAHWREKVERLQIVKLFKLTSLFTIYDRIRSGK